MVQYTLEQHVFLYDTMWNMDLLENVGENFDVNFVRKEFSADKHFTIWWINLEQQDCYRQETEMCRVLTEEKLDAIGARLDHIPRKYWNV
jgi:hypothetical protein